MIFNEKKIFKISEDGKLGKLSLCSSNILNITCLEDGGRDSSEEQGEQPVMNDSSERNLGQSENSEEEESMRYDETNLLCSEFCLLFPEEPSSYSSALKQEVWREVMKEEISAILKNKTWTVVKPQGNIKTIGVRWVFRVKKDSKGRILRHKASEGICPKRRNRFWLDFLPCCKDGIHPNLECNCCTRKMGITSLGC